MGSAGTELAVLGFGHIVVAELDELACTEQVATAIANIECDQPLGRQDGPHERRTHAERILVLVHELIEVPIGILDDFRAGGWLRKPVNRSNQIIEYGSAGHRAMRVATHAVRNHKETAIVRWRHDDRHVHVAGEDTIVDRDSVLVVRAHATAMGEGSNGPAWHTQTVARSIVGSSGGVWHIDLLPAIVVTRARGRASELFLHRIRDSFQGRLEAFEFLLVLFDALCQRRKHRATLAFKAD